MLKSIKILFLASILTGTMWQIRPIDIQWEQTPINLRTYIERASHEIGEPVPNEAVIESNITSYALASAVILNDAPTLLYFFEMFPLTDSNASDYQEVLLCALLRDNTIMFRLIFSEILHYLSIKRNTHFLDAVVAAEEITLIISMFVGTIAQGNLEIFQMLLPRIINYLQEFKQPYGVFSSVLTFDEDLLLAAGIRSGHLHILEFVTSLGHLPILRHLIEHRNGQSIGNKNIALKIARHLNRMDIVEYLSSQQV